MGKLISIVGIWVISSVITRIFAALGIGLFTYKAIYTAIDGFISYIEPILSSLPQDTLNIFALMGVPEALSIMLSAYATAASLKALAIFVGVRT